MPRIAYYPRQLVKGWRLDAALPDRKWSCTCTNCWKSTEIRAQHLGAADRPCICPHCKQVSPPYLMYIVGEDILRVCQAVDMWGTLCLLPAAAYKIFQGNDVLERPCFVKTVTQEDWYDIYAKFNNLPQPR